MRAGLRARPPRSGDHATNIAETLYFMVNGTPLTESRPKGDGSSSSVVLQGITGIVAGGTRPSAKPATPRTGKTTAAKPTGRTPK